MYSYDDYLRNVRAKKERIKQTDLSPLLDCEELKRYDRFDKVVFVDRRFDEWDGSEISISIEKKSHGIILSYRKIVENGENENTSGNSGESRLKVFRNDEENIGLFRLLCNETYRAAHYVYHDETGYEMPCYASLLSRGYEIRTDFVSPPMIAVLLRFVDDIPDAFINDAEENYESLPKRDHPNVIREAASGDGRIEEKNVQSETGNNGLLF